MRNLSLIVILFSTACSGPTLVDSGLPAEKLLSELSTAEMDTFCLAYGRADYDAFKADTAKWCVSGALTYEHLLDGLSCDSVAMECAERHSKLEFTPPPSGVDCFEHAASCHYPIHTVERCLNLLYEINAQLRDKMSGDGCDANREIHREHFRDFEQVFGEECLAVSACR